MSILSQSVSTFEVIVQLLLGIFQLPTRFIIINSSNSRMSQLMFYHRYYLNSLSAKRAVGRFHDFEEGALGFEKCLWDFVYRRLL